MGVNGISCIFRLVLEGKTGKDIPESSQKSFQQTTLLYLMQKTTLQEQNFSEFRAQSFELSFWEVIDSFVLVAILTASRILWQRLLACLNFHLDVKKLFCLYKRNMWFLWARVAAQAAEDPGDEWDWPDIYDEGHIH